MNSEEPSILYTNIDSNEIVISGIAGRFPDSDNMNHLQENLFNKIDLVRTDHSRWKLDHSVVWDIPARMGTVPNIEKFDADFFDVSFAQAHTLDPMTRMLMEHIFEAIVDAGVNPKQLRGKDTAVIIGTSFVESQETFLYSNLQVNGLGIIGCSKTTMANMISHWLDVKGPSYVVDTACSSSITAMALAFQSIMSGQCQDAIVATSNLCLHPILNLQFARLGVLAPDGYCRPFDIGASGYARGEALVTIYLQKAKNAKRIYAICKHVKLNCDGYKDEGITFPSTYMQTVLLTEFYNECQISPVYLDYIETHGTSTKVGDPAEINAIYKSLCKNRKTPLMIGSVKSNLGHAEPASGLIQLAKVIIAMETGFVPPNINFTSPRTDIEALATDSIRVVTEPLPLKNGYIAINSFGFGGANGHLLLEWNPKTKHNDGSPADDLPRLVTLSGRTEDALQSFLSDIVSKPVDVEYVRLLQNIHADNIDGHPWRGYTILYKSQQNAVKEIQHYDNVRRPVCFIFSALGSQWPQMGKELLKFHVFANAIRKCDAILKTYDISVSDILSKTDRHACENALHTFLGIVAIQIGLVDLLESLGIIPDYMIGHSAAELGCAYSDKCLTIEQTILSAYFIGMALADRRVIRSSVAVVVLDRKYLQKICPADIEVICYNGKNNNIVSGPTKSVQQFVKKLQANNIQTKEITCNNIPYHSRYLETLRTQLLSNLNQVIPQPKERSSRWISTSIPRDEWSSQIAKFSSAEYHTHSILNTVLFEQTINIIPTNAVTIELAPDSVLQSILKECLHSKVTNVVLIQRVPQNAIDVILRGIGKLYNCGLQPQLANLYPPVEFPVSRGTPMISPSIRWNHSEDWFVTAYQTQKPMKSRERIVEINLKNENYNFMTGHVIDGRNLLPATGYLAIIWETIGMIKGEIYTTIPIVFKNIKFLRATHLPKDGTVEFAVSIQKDSGKFEIIDGESVVVTGTVYALSTSNYKEEIIASDLLPEDDDEEEHLSSRDIYKELKLRGYQYSGGFRGLKSATIPGRKGHIAWENNWVTFMDTMLQMHVISYDMDMTRNLHVPTDIQKIIIDPALHARKLCSEGTKTDEAQPCKLPVPTIPLFCIVTALSVRVYKELDAIISGGIEIRGVRYSPISRRKPTEEPLIEEHRFVAHFDNVEISLKEAVRISAQLAIEDHQIVDVKAIEVVDDTDNVKLEDLSSLLLIEAFADISLIQTNIFLLTSPTRFNISSMPPNISVVDLNVPFVDDNALIVTGFNLLTKQQNILERFLPLLREGGYLLTREKSNIADFRGYLQLHGLNVILEKRTDKEKILLLKKKVLIKATTVINIKNDNFDWLEDLKALISDDKKLDDNSRILILGEGDIDSGLLGFVNCLRKEPGGKLVRGMFIQDKEAPKFSLQDPFYIEQLQKDMTVNVLRLKKTWGSYRHLKLPYPEAKSVSAAYVDQAVRGDLSTFRWVENNISADIPNEDLVHVIYSSINFKDVMLATGKLMPDISTISRRRNEDMSLGLEYVGFDSKGKRVMGIRDNKCIANVLVKDVNLCWDIPDTWTFEEAATVPCVYGTSLYALYIYGKIRKKDKVLIHSGAGGVGQAAIHLALQEGCEVFTTVGTVEKRKFIRETFPSIPDENIGNSRDTSFEQMIMRQTNGRGVDIVLNSLAEEKLIASVRCLAQNGRFLEIGKFDFVSDNPLGMSAFLKQIHFHGISLDSMMAGNHKYKHVIWQMMSDALKNGVIKPIQAMVFSKTMIETAFRYMTLGKHIGKVILKIQENEKYISTHVIAHRRYYCVANKSYIILGGLGGFGLELVDWLVQRGARNIILTSRTGIKTGYQRKKITLWDSYGVNVLIIKNIDVTNPKDCEYLLQSATKIAPVDAIFNLAAVMKDSILKNHIAETFAESFTSKGWATQLLDKLSRKICPDLRHFVVFSSISCGKGNAGLTNYGMANSIMERICERRVEEGLPGLAIQWGAVGDVGIVADMQEDEVVGGTLQQRIFSCLEVLEKFLLQNRPVVSSMIIAEKKICSTGNSMVDAVATIMNIKNIQDISHNLSLAELGMDSMMTVEVMQSLERKFNVFLTAQEMRNLTFAKLIEMSSTNNNKNMQVKTVTSKLDTRLRLISTLKDADFVSEICIDLPTKKEKNSSQAFLIPGIDGCASVFKYLASGIKFSAMALQITTSNVDSTSSNSISEIADYLLKIILSKSRSDKDFVIVGYSFGSIFAIELTRRLEAINCKCRLVLIDGAPEFIQALNERHVSCSSNVELQNYVLENILITYSIQINEESLAELKQCKTWNEKFETFAKYFLAVNTLFSPANLRTLCTTIYKYLAAVKQYDSSALPPIKPSVMLLKPTISLISNIEEDYGLHKITQGKVEVYHVEGNHFTMLRNEKVIAAINGEPL